MVPPTPRRQLFPAPQAVVRTSINCALAVNAAGKRSMSENFMVLDRVCSENEENVYDRRTVDRERTNVRENVVVV